MKRALAVCALLLGCGGGEAAEPAANADANENADADADGAADSADAIDSDAPTSPRGFPERAPWVSFYGTASEMGDLAKVAATFRVINVDVDPDGGNFTDAQLATLRAGGKNRVISYLNLGACETYRSYWATSPSGFLSCKANTKAHRGAYDGYPDETWMDVGDADYQKLMVEHVAARLAARGVDGFFLDNLEIVEHGTATTNGPCDAKCAQGGLDLVRRLRERFPGLLIVMQNATSDVTRLGKTGGVDLPSLLDGISHEEVYAPSYDPDAEKELLAWRDMKLAPGGRPFFIATEDYVGSCAATAKAKAAYDKSRANGFSPYATDESGGQKVVCYWPF
ncbi:MAG: endo alpha-1,4 polygalactosaminidase [Deltaproteobacteria bacterium]|nr:endo alpha-1,4 polygalactosaminidase [Deltaproteobacteria bacterium]